jgi:hypothetical protein
LFFTDNRNQPRVINTKLANPNPSDTNPTHYTTEDQISVAKFNPYKAIELFQSSILSTGDNYETTMKDVSSKFMPNGGLGTKSGPYTGSTSIELDAGTVVGDIIDPTVFTTAITKVGYITSSGGNIIVISNATVSTTAYDAASNKWTITITGGNFPTIPSSETYQIIINPNPYYDSTFSGDPDYLEDKFVRFSYRYRFVDNTYSIFAPFTQVAFIPKQDGYFLYVKKPGVQEVDDQSETYRSTVVYFMENKVNQIDLKIPLPHFTFNLANYLKVKEIDILYKESDALSVKVIETIPIEDISSSASICQVNNFSGPSNIIPVDNIQGVINIGDIIFGGPILESDEITIVDFTPTNPQNITAGNITVSSIVSNLDPNTVLNTGDIQNFVYTYKSTKPTKTLPEAQLTRVFDKVPVRALAQEVAGNRVIYGNFLNKIDPPAFIDYNVACTEKSDFSLNQVIATYNSGSAKNLPPGSIININTSKLLAPPAGLFPGMTVSSPTVGTNIPTGTIITSTDNLAKSTTTANITLNQSVTFPSYPVTLIFSPGADTQNTTSKIEYPNSSVKTNRNYQVGFVLSDKFGRQSSVILSNNKRKITVNNVSYSGSTFYSPYIDQSVDKDQWPGNSIKILVNNPVAVNNLYNGDVTSSSYNPLGWYSYKVVVKQTEQDYYNVYLPGIMSGYPDDDLLEIGQTSHTVLINDNINKVPRDLSEVGPEQKQFRSSVQLFGRVENTTIVITDTNPGDSNTQYYPETKSDTVSTIATAVDLFDYDAANPLQPNFFPQFYSIDSNPLIARITTEKRIGQLATTNYAPAAAVVNASQAPSSGTPTETSTIDLTNIVGSINPGDLVEGGDLPEGVYVHQFNAATTGPPVPANIVIKRGNDFFDVIISPGVELTFTPSSNPSLGPPFIKAQPGLQHLAVYETEPVESLLDIYWETTTSGLISDLNDQIANNQLNPAATNIQGWNADCFNEGLAPQSNILCAPFNIANNFGEQITLDVASGEALILQEVLDGNGNLVGGTNSSFTSTPNSPSDYFRLVDTSAGTTGIGPWQIRTTSNSTDDPTGDPAYQTTAPLDYYSNIFYMYNTPGDFTNGLRNFTFKFLVTREGQSFEIIEQADLRNVVPLFTKVTGLDATIPGSPLLPPNIPTSPSVLQIEAQRDSSFLAAIETSNGANNPNLQSEDLDFVGYTNYTPPSPYIFQQTIGSPSSTAPEALLDGAPIFGLTPGGTLVNNMSNNEYLQPLVYYVIIRLQDGGDFVEMIIEIDMSLDLPTGIVSNQVIHSVQTMGGMGNYFSQPSAENSNLYGGDNFIGRGPFYEGATYYNAGSTQFSSDATTSSTYGRVMRPVGHPYTLIKTIAGGIPGLLPEQQGYFAYAAGFFNNSFESQQGGTNQSGDRPFTRFSRALTARYGVESSLPLDSPPIVIPWNSPDAFNHKVIRTNSPNMIEFGSDGTTVGKAYIMVYGIAEITAIDLTGARSLRSSFGGGNRRTTMSINMISGKFPHPLMRLQVVPQAETGTPHLPPVCYTTYPISLSGDLDNNKIVTWTCTPDSSGNAGDISIAGNVQSMNLQGGGINGNTDRVNHTPQVGDKIYFYGGDHQNYEDWAEWWNNSENTYYGSPWYFNTDLEQLQRTLNYSPWAGPGSQWYCWNRDCSQNLQFDLNRPSLKHTLPADCTNNSNQWYGANYLATVTYAGIEGEVENYSNLNWELI